MSAIRVVTRLALSIVFGWPLTLAPVLVTEPLEIIHGWGYMHSGLPLIIYPLAVWLLFYLLGRVPDFMSKKSPAKEQ
jgi:hypothetical protein